MPLIFSFEHFTRGGRRLWWPRNHEACVTGRTNPGIDSPDVGHSTTWAGIDRVELFLRRQSDERERSYHGSQSCSWPAEAKEDAAAG